MRKVKIMLLAAAGSAAAALSGCSIVNEYLNYNDTANQIVKSFESNDMEAINEAIFGEGEFSVDEELTDYYVEEEGEGIISQIVAVGSIKVKHVDVINKVVVYDVTAPNMQTVLEDMPEEISTEEEFSTYIKEYIANADITTTPVSVPYTEDGESIVLEYENPEFINAITGGFMEAYQNAYKEMIETYLSGLEGLE